MTLPLLRDISIVWLSIQCFVMLLIPLAIFYFIVRGVNAAHNGLYGLLKRGQTYSHALKSQTQTVGVRVSTPVIQLQRTISRVETIIQQLDPRVNQQENQ
ncbi:MAG: hypothetical protein AAF639_44140 [Chloroflexota bacterium]